MRVLDLFSGIGGFSIGLERAGMQTVAFCEIEPFCRAVLKKHWPSVPCYDDIRTLTAERLSSDGIAADVICGGFPCQDVSEVGSRAGIEGKQSGLWREMHRIICEIRPGYVIVENVTGLLDRGLERVLRELAESGFDAEWSVFPACALGAAHSRERVFLLAYPNKQRLQASGPFGNGNDASSHGGRERTEYIYSVAVAIGRKVGEAFASEPELDRVAHGIPNRVDRIKALGNAVVPQIPEIIGRAIMAAEGQCVSSS